MLDCTATGGRKGPNALPLTSCHLTVRNSILASGSGNSPVGSVSITATFPSWTRSLWRSRPSLPTGLNPIIRSDDYAQLLKTFSLNGPPLRIHLSSLRLFPIPDRDTLPIIGCRSDHRFDKLY